MQSRFFPTVVITLALILALGGVIVVAGDGTVSSETLQERQAMSNAAFIKFDGVDGEAQDKDHKGWSDIVSYSQAIKPSAVGRPGGVVLEDILVTKELDKSSPKLAEAVVRGTVFPKVELNFTANVGEEEGRVTYYAYELKNVQVTSYNIGTLDNPGQLPSEQMTLNFEEIKVTYVVHDERGQELERVEYTWPVGESRR